MPQYSGRFQVKEHCSLFLEMQQAHNKRGLHFAGKRPEKSRLNVMSLKHPILLANIPAEEGL